MGGESDSREVSRILRAAERGDAADLGTLFRLVYGRLRAIAARHMAGERDGHTLQATALVHEAYLKLVGGEPVPWEGKAQFYAAAASAMRRILIDHARGKRRVKRGGERRRIPLDALDLASRDDFEEIVSVDEAVRRLQGRDERLARLVELRFYAGLSAKETAEVLGVTDRQVRRDWVLARAWLQRELSGG
jgi:RNA polymerase sigma factor (TIGR02999 family)